MSRLEKLIQECCPYGVEYKKIKDVEKNVDLEKLYRYIKGMKQNEKVLKMLEEIQ